MTSRPIFPALLVALLLGGVSPLAPGLIFFATSDAAHNREVAPGGAWAGSGWQYQGEYKNFLGTMISPRHFLSARHLGTGSDTFVHKTWFSGAAMDRTYYLNPNVNGGLGYWNIAGTDLRVFEVYGDFPWYAPLYSGSDEAGKEAVLMGRGRGRGPEVTLMDVTRGWEWGGNDKRVRWGVNTVDSIEPLDSLGDFLVTDFDEAPGTEECHAASGDSGGALFLKDGLDWKLAGIMYAVDGKYDPNAVCGDSSDFHAALFDASGFYLGEDNAECDGWELVSVSADERESRTYSSRVSTSLPAIQPIIQDALDDAAKTSTERYEDWIAGFELTGGIFPEGDADGDLEPNVVEYLSALNPGAVDEPLRTFAVEDAGNKIRFTVRLRLDREARGLSWELRQTDELAAQIFVPVTGLTVVSLTRLLSEGVETIQYEIPKPVGPRMFYRLEVTLAP